MGFPARTAWAPGLRPPLTTGPLGRALPSDDGVPPVRRLVRHPLRLASLRERCAGEVVDRPSPTLTSLRQRAAVCSCGVAPLRRPENSARLRASLAKERGTDCGQTVPPARSCRERLLPSPVWFLAPLLRLWPGPSIRKRLLALVRPFTRSSSCGFGCVSCGWLIGPVINAARATNSGRRRRKPGATLRHDRKAKSGFESRSRSASKGHKNHGHS